MERSAKRGSGASVTLARKGEMTMIPEYQFYHGAALAVLVSRREFTGLSRIVDLGAAYAARPVWYSSRSHVLD